MKIVPKIHARSGGSRLDGVLELVAFAARPCPLTTSLDELPRRMAKIFGADVCSIYLLEGGDLVMRGNVGFPLGALGEVRLAVGEGITGMAVESMRPISVDAAPENESYRHFPSLGEERFPIFLAMPVPGPNGPLGAVVLQRREPPAFDLAQIELAGALTVPIAAAAERAKLNEAVQGQKRATGGGTRRVTLAGRPAGPGRAVGAICAFRRPATRSAPEARRPMADVKRALDHAVREAVRTVDGFEKRAVSLGVEGAFFQRIRTILDDARILERVMELAEQGQGLAQALGAVGAEAARAAATRGDSFGVDRAREIADVCEALAMLSSTDRRAEVPRGAVLVGSEVTLFDVLVSARSQPLAVVLSERGGGPVTRTLLSLLGIPAVVDVAGLFRWAADGDIALVDGDHGLVRINPSRAEISMVRAEKKHRADVP